MEALAGSEHEGMISGGRLPVPVTAGNRSQGPQPALTLNRK